METGPARRPAVTSFWVQFNGLTSLYTLVGPIVIRPVQDPLDVKLLYNRLYMLRIFEPSPIDNIMDENAEVESSLANGRKSQIK